MHALVVITAVTLAAGPPKLNGPDPEQRTAAVEAWAKNYAPVALPVSDGASGAPCNWVSAPRELQCTKRIWLCVGGHSFSIGGNGVAVLETKEARLFTSKLRPGPPSLDQERLHDLFPESKTPLLSHFSGARSIGHCYYQTPSSYFPREFSEDVREHLRKERKASAHAEFRRCREEQERRDRERDIDVKCELLLINPCRQELFARCSGKNVDKLSEQEPERVPGADQVFRLTWARDEDAQN